MAISAQFEGKTPYSRLFINPILRKKKDKMWVDMRKDSEEIQPDKENQSADLGEASVRSQASQNIHATPVRLIVPSLKAGKYTSNGTSCTQLALIIAGAVHLAHWFGK